MSTGPSRSTRQPPRPADPPASTTIETAVPRVASPIVLAATFATSVMCGFCLMALEIVGARVLYPSFGSSIDVWAAVITVFILSLSVGQIAGGWLADRTATNAPLGWVIIAAGAVFCVLPVYMLHASLAVADATGGARSGALFAALALFFAPSVLLGMVLPMAVKLVFVRPERIGRTVGTLYAVGSVGNVAGILVTDYVLLVHLPLNTNLIVLGTSLSVVGVAHLAVRVRSPGLERT